jgi:hypothetical protein
MDDILPALIALALFPVSFFMKRLQGSPKGFLLPLLLSVVFLGAILLRAGPAYLNALFAILAMGIAWRWRAASRPGRLA